MKALFFVLILVFCIGSSYSQQVPEQRAKYNDEFKRFIVMRLKYPIELMASGLEGTVVVQFSVTEQGALDQIDVLKSPDKQLSASVMTALLETKGMWTPAQNAGEPVEDQFKLVINYFIKNSMEKGDNIAREYYKKALSKREKQKIDKAMGLVNKSIEMNPWYFESYQLRSELEAELGMTTEAEADVRRTQQLKDEVIGIVDIVGVAVMTTKVISSTVTSVGTSRY